MKCRISAIIFFAILGVFFDFCVSDSTLNTVVVPAEYNKTYQRFGNSSIEYIFRYREVEESLLDGARIFVESKDATIDDPLIVVVKQKRGTLSWQIPMYAGDNQDNGTLYDRTSRNLCPSKYYQSIKGHNIRKNAEPEIYVSITISTASKTNISFDLILLPVLDFYLKSGESRNVTINPSEPVYYGHIYDNYSSNVLIDVSSKENVCMTFAIEPTLCPVFDYQGNRHFTGLWQTVTSQGAITVSNQDYPHGFFIVLTVNPDIKTCSDDDVETNRTKNIILSINDAMTESGYVFPTIGPLLIFIVFCIFYVISALSCKVHHPPSFESIEEENLDENNSSNQTESEDQINGISVENHQANVNNDLQNVLNDSGHHRITQVRDLLKKEITILRKNSHLYVRYLIIIGTFYVVPVMQLVLNYEKMLRLTGNQDLCYYNFLCSHPLFVFSDFNHIFSNFAYVLLGLLFIFIVYMRERNDTLNHKNAQNANLRQYGLFYAMGFALMMEGLLSASYHVCPNHDNFQFDTCFMYIISILCIMKLYQNRHPDITAEAHVTFSAIAITLILGLAGIRGDNDRYFWIGFTIIHISFCLLLSVKIYYMKSWRSIGRKLLKTAKAVRTGIRVHITHPYYPKRLWLIIVGNFFNLILAIAGNINHLQIDFPTYLLGILMMNLLIYVIYYIIMKKRHKEKILPQPLVHIILSLISWGGAFYCFQEQTSHNSDSPANAREHNHACLLWNFYDFHDIWHFVSAVSTFFSFMVVFTLDDDLRTCDSDVF